ncbi:MAG: 1-acyl-sn-glycerol-3-phosphate acyltransferase [Clostridia bacterium]|nr:1-acyl-sn-glycerol-3-phosphate acyltransferase [Clostridia bacterium]
MFDPKTKKYPYPLDTATHYLVVKKNDGTVFDRDYPYVDRSAWMRFKQALIRVLLYILVFPVMTVRTGLKVKGRKNLKKHREELKGGVISVSNHIHMWDYIGVMRAAIPRRTNILAWDKNVRGENGKLIRLVGGIPVPENDIHATSAMMKALGEQLDGGWVHVYSEGSMWEFYQPIRPFKSGAAYLSCKFDKPILPLAFSYRKPGFIRKKIFRQIARLTLTVGEPVYPDKSLPRDKRVEDLIIRSHEAVCRLAGIEPSENLYPPVYDNNTRVDYY